jgi:methylenetetrahydrofolate dehydrogenase (NADP+)/methenyltetrahydrofolate cyclohydrolase
MAGHTLVKSHSASFRAKMGSGFFVESCLTLYMTKILNGRELADFIKGRQAHQVRSLIQHDKIQPKLAILTTSRAGYENAPIETYIRMKQKYGADINVEVEIFRKSISEIPAIIRKLNFDEKIHGVIVQLPLNFDDTNLSSEEILRQTDEIINLVAPEKDVDALGENATLDPATPMAVNWLLAGYNIEFREKNIVIVGNGRLVGKPLAKMWRDSHLKVEVLDKKTFESREAFRDKLLNADIIVSATGVANLIKSEDVKIGAIVVDAGTASEQGKIVGDVAPEVRERTDLVITPEKGGVGPLTIVALMDNVIRAARSSLKQ